MSAHFSSNGLTARLMANPSGRRSKGSVVSSMASKRGSIPQWRGQLRKLPVVDSIHSSTTGPLRPTAPEDAPTHHVPTNLRQRAYTEGSPDARKNLYQHGRPQ